MGTPSVLLDRDGAAIESEDELPPGEARTALMAAEDTVLLTAASSRWFRALLNLIGSVQFWAPGMRILVYDLGLHPRERSQRHRCRH